MWFLVLILASTGVSFADDQSCDSNALRKQHQANRILMAQDAQPYMASLNALAKTVRESFQSSEVEEIRRDLTEIENAQRPTDASVASLGMSLTLTKRISAVRARNSKISCSSKDQPVIWALSESEKMFSTGLNSACHARSEAGYVASSRGFSPYFAQSLHLMKGRTSNVLVCVFGSSVNEIVACATVDVAESQDSDVSAEAAVANPEAARVYKAVNPNHARIAFVQSEDDYVRTMTAQAKCQQNAAKPNAVVAPPSSPENSRVIQPTSHIEIDTDGNLHVVESK